MRFGFDIPFRGRARAWAALTALAICAALPATAQQPSQDPPARVARLNVHEGAVSFSPAGEDGWYDVVPNRPLTSGDRLWTDHAARAEVFVGSTAVRIDAQTSLEFTRIDDATVQLTLSRGSLDLHVRDDLDGQRLEIDTGNLAMLILAPGDYRVDADAEVGTTRVAVAAGSATVYGENGAPVPIGERRQITVSGRDLGAADTRAAPGAGAFDRWVAERNRIDERSVSARHVSRDLVGYQQLDAYGDWRSDAGYGSVWYPRNVAAEWAPYRDGQWVDIAPWGWTWVDAAPWGFAPSHYGRWARVGPRWGWVPGRIAARPVFAPALVGFVGGAGAVPGMGGRHVIGWFPLAPGERWQPGYTASQRYVEQANRTTIRIDRPLQRNDFYINQRIVEAVTIVPSERFGRGPIDRRDVLRQRDEAISRAPVAHAPPLTLAATVAGGAGGVPVGPALGALDARPAAAVPPPLLQPRAQLPPIRPLQPRPQFASTEGPALQQRQQQLQALDQRREEQQQVLRRQQMQQRERQDDQRRAAAQQEQQRQDLRRLQENRANAARDQQQRERQRDDEQRRDQQRQDQREQDRRQQAQRAERDRQEQERQAQYRQEQQRQQVQQQQHASQLRAQEQQLQLQRQRDRQQQAQQQSMRLQEAQQSQERALQQRQMQQQQTERRSQQVRDEQRRDEQRRQQQQQR